MKSSIYLKYRGTWVLYVIGLAGLIIQLPTTLLLTLSFIRGTFSPLWLIVNAWVGLFIILISVYAGVYWIIHKEGANFSLVVGFLITLVSYLILVSILGQLNATLVLGM